MTLQTKTTGDLVINYCCKSYKSKHEMGMSYRVGMSLTGRQNLAFQDL